MRLEPNAARTRFAWRHALFSTHGRIVPSAFSPITHPRCQSSIPRVFLTSNCPHDTLNCIYRHLHLLILLPHNASWARRDEQASPSAGLARAGSRTTDTTNGRPSTPGRYEAPNKRHRMRSSSPHGWRIASMRPWASRASSPARRESGGSSICSRLR